MKRLRVSNITEQGHNLMNSTVTDTANLLKGAYFVIKIDDALKDRGLTQKQLAQMTGMRVGTVSDLVNGKGNSINKVQLFAIMAALRITDLSELIEMQFPDDLAADYERQSTEWKATANMPTEVREMYKTNILKESGLE